MTIDEFKEKATKKHNGRYDYSKVEYINSQTKVCIICKEHGEFFQAPSKHLYGQGCPICGAKQSHESKTFTNQEFIEKSIKIHNKKYDYSKVDYINSKIKVCIICPDHGEFWQEPHVHLRGCGCPVCGGNYRKNNEVFIEQAKNVHGEKYDYKFVEYINHSTKIKIICHKKDKNDVEHGEFWQTPNHHLRGIGCPKCGKEVIGMKNSYNNNTFIEKANIVHNGKYDYSETEYKSCFEYVDIICPIHGIFKQIASYHLYGNGCQKCSMSSLERKVINLLLKYNINYIHKKHFEWLKNKSNMEIDFYLPDLNIGIECQGIQHFEYRSFGSTVCDMSVFESQIERDKLKKTLCDENGVKLYYINYDTKNITEDFLKIIKKTKIQ